MGISLKPKHLKRYKDIALLLIKYGRSDVVKHAGLQDALELDASVETTAGAAKADELAQDLEKMGPTYIKLGQLLSTRADFLPPAYIHALTRLQDKIDPFPYYSYSGEGSPFEEVRFKLNPRVLSFRIIFCDCKADSFPGAYPAIPTMKRTKP